VVARVIETKVRKIGTGYGILIPKRKLEEIGAGEGVTVIIKRIERPAKEIRGILRSSGFRFERRMEDRDSNGPLQ
jgi:hypothetical protein